MSTLRACVAEILSSPEPPEEGRVDDWLAQRGVGLVPVADPQAFGWPGPFLGRRDAGWAVLFGTPPGTLSGVADGPLREAWVIAPYAAPVAPAAAASTSGVVELIAIAAAARAPMRAVASAVTEAGRGLLGDRYADGDGTFSDGTAVGRDLTLVAAEALDEAGVTALEARRNIVVRGVDLDALLGRRFRIGAVECVGQRRCEPCAHLERLTRPGVLRSLVHRGGLRADVVVGGELRRGDRIEAL